MKKRIATLIAGGLASVFVAFPAAANTLGPHAARCDNGQSSVIVNVTGFRNRGGTVRVQIFTANQETYLQRRQWLTRVDLPVTASGDMAICMPVPRAGNYVISVRHDANGNGSSDRSDGGGFSGNPNMGLTDIVLRRRPPLARVSFAVANAPARQNVVLNYVQGTRVGPIR